MSKPQAKLNVPALVVPSVPREDARLTLPDGRVFSAPIGTAIEHYVNAAYPADHPERPILGAIIDNRLCELTTPITRDVAVKLITLRDSDGGRIYRRSLVMLLTTAIEELFDGAKVAVEHSVPSGGYFCQMVGRDRLSQAELQKLKKKMRELIELDLPITRTVIPLTEAIQKFTEQGDEDMVRLLGSRTKPYLTIYSLRNNVDYFFGYMVPSTGYLRQFDLKLTAEGFMLIFPRPEQPNVLQRYEESPQLKSIFRQTNEWLRVMNLEDVGRLNESIAAGRLREEVLIAEALHSRMFGEMARLIAQQFKNGLKIVMIAGPSSAGKTTSSKRLAIQLMAYGLQPYTLGMDNYFVDREQTPLDETGAFDFEALEALDLPRFNRDLLAMMNSERVQIPNFNFRLGRSEPGETIQLTKDSIIIIEGIHGLNPALVSEIPPEKIFRIYVSALTALNLNRHNRIPTTDVRLLRRMVRDAAHRGYSAQDTLDRWESVRRGEKRNIFPFQENADVMFNSSLAYELAVIRPQAEPLLRQVDLDSPRYVEAKRLLAFLSWVRPAEADFVPNQSLLREFVGGSVLETYSPGERINAFSAGLNVTKLP